MASKKIRPRLLFAESDGSIYDHPDLLMLTRRGNEIGLPRPDELIALPEESDLFFLPGRHALGLDPETGQTVQIEENAVAAFVCPGHTLSGTTAYVAQDDAPTLPLFAYGAAGYANGRIYVCATRTDTDMRQVFTGIPKKRIRQGVARLRRALPENRLVEHLAGCALTSCCPAARNLALGRFEAPLPTSRACNAKCLGCISLQPKSAGFPSTQNRISFTPTPEEVVSLMLEHAASEPRPIFSFGQGCEGDPLTEGALLVEATKRYRETSREGTINVNTNAGIPEAVAELGDVGLSSMRVTMVSARESLYMAYHNPSYRFEHVLESIDAAKKRGVYVSLNLLFFPGVTDTEDELEALEPLIADKRVDLIQMRNLNLDPDMYMNLVNTTLSGQRAPMGLGNFMKRLKASAPDLAFGYFNPWLG
ncbi:radical SAM protein [Desulfovibrio inopinatus]|uniref:radical SAM protein n=1 Tax=Desulfovibrio inopinatus TaxID=102109 RepID=UPI00041E7E87|nr:radical SAM protein [Desulfovibrio inopinatus]